MFNIPEMMEDVVGRATGNKGKKGNDPGVLGEAREGIVGGCWGLVMSIAFFFVFYFVVIAFFSGGVEELGFSIGSAALPLMLLLCLSGVLSPFFGVFFGVRGGKYRLTQHFGCFFIYLGAIIGGIVALSVLI